MYYNTVFRVFIELVGEIAGGKRLQKRIKLVKSCLANVVNPVKVNGIIALNGALFVFWLNQTHLNRCRVVDPTLSPAVLSSDVHMSKSLCRNRLRGNTRKKTGSEGGG